jgi:hypothetical protein
MELVWMSTTPGGAHAEGHAGKRSEELATLELNVDMINEDCLLEEQGG